MRSVTSYREHIRVKANATRRIFETAYGSFPGIEEIIDSRPGDDDVYDYLQERINDMHERSNSLNTIMVYFGHIRQYLHFRGIKLNPIDIKQSLNFPKRHKEEMRPLGLPAFQTILRNCSRKKEMLYLAQSSSGMRIGEDAANQEKGYPYAHGKTDGKDTGKIHKNGNGQDHVLQRRGRQNGDAATDEN